MKLKVLARGNVLCALHEAAGSIQRRYVGRKPVVLESDPGVDPIVEWHPIEEPSEVPVVAETSPHFRMYFAEYVRELKEGALWPADEETAKAAGVPFDPKFGEVE